MAAAVQAEPSGTGTEAAAVLDMDTARHEIAEADETGEAKNAGGPSGTASGEGGSAAVLGGIREADLGDPGAGQGGDLSGVGVTSACSGVAAEEAEEAEEEQADKVPRVEGTATVAEVVRAASSAAKEAIEAAARAAGATTTTALAGTEATNPPPATLPPPVETAAATTTETIDTAPRATPLPAAAAAAAAEPLACSAVPDMGPSMVPAMVPAAMAAQLSGYTYASGSNVVTLTFGYLALALYHDHSPSPIHLVAVALPYILHDVYTYTLHLIYSRSGLGDMSPQFAIVSTTGGSLSGVPFPSSMTQAQIQAAQLQAHCWREP